MKSERLGPTAGEDRAKWTAAVFAAGDYAGAAMFGDPVTWQWRAARAMLLGEGAAMSALSRDPEPEARLHFGAARWIHGDDAGALAILDDCELPHARALSRLIRRDRIQVLAQLPWMRGSLSNLMSAAEADPRFQIRNVGYHVEDIRNQPYADVRRFLDADFVPDFYVSAMVEWHHLPPNLQQLQCPILGHIADHDLHVQTVQPWLALFDELVVTDRSEWLDVQNLSPGLGSARPVTSFPKVFGLPTDLPAIPTAERFLDFFVSGTMLDEYHPDKAALMHELLSIPDIRLRVVRGHAGSEAYHALLSASQASFTYVRRPGALPTRGLEALAMGCALATQEDSILNLWVGEREGVVRYGPDAGDLAAAIQRILAEREPFGAAARRGAEIVRRAFDMPQVAAQYLRYLTFRSAAPRNQRRLVDTASLPQKRISVYKAWLPDSPVARRRSMQANFAFLGDVVQREPSATVVNDMARELICEFGYYDHHEITESEERTLLADALALLERGMLTWPDRLVLRFNFVRTALHHGTPEQRVQALQLAFDTLDLEIEWRVDAMDDVLPFDFHPEFFNYRDYLALVAARCAGDATVTDRSLAELMLAAIAGYLGRKTGKVSLHERAAELDPEFARYRLDLATSLVGEGDAAAIARAIPILEELAAGSTQFPAAAELLETLRGAGARTAGGGLALRRLREDTIDTAVEARELFLIERRAPQVAKQVRMALPAAQKSRLAVLVPLTGDGLELSSLLAGLQNQTIAGDLEVLVVAVRGDRAIADTFAAYQDGGLALRAVEVPVEAGYVERLNACAQAAEAPLLTIAMPGDLFRADAFEQLVAELDGAPEAAIVNASEGWIGEPLNEFRPEIIAAVSCRPGFSRERLFAVDCVGLHAVWRRALHEQCGWFDPGFGAAAEYEMWLRGTATSGGGVRQRREVLVASPLNASWRRARDVAAAPADMERARQAHREALDRPLPPLAMHRVLPAVLFTPSLRDEAEVHARLGILSTLASRNVKLSEDFFGTALMHGDIETALLTIATCAERHPSLLSARLTWARLLEALGRPGADEVLRAGLGDEPYATLLRDELARRGVADPSADVGDPPGVAALADFILPCPR